MNSIEVRPYYMVPNNLGLNQSLILLIFQFKQDFKVSEYQFLYP